MTLLIFLSLLAYSIVLGVMCYDQGYRAGTEELEKSNLNQEDF